MLISSEFRDYYDTALAHGIDKTCVYRRRTEVVPVPECLKALPLYREHPKHDWEYSFWVGFCGRLYYGQYFHTSGAQSNVVKYGAEHLRTRQEQKRPTTDILLRRPCREDVEELEQRDWSQVFVDLDVPVFVCKTAGYVRNTIELKVNPRLKPWEFFKVFDPFAACGAIQMFLQNDLVKENPVEPVLDKYKIKAHSMDHTSFRRDPGGPTRKRKKKSS
jgi:hypothetical protein